MLLDCLQRIPCVAQVVNANVKMRKRFVLGIHLGALTLEFRDLARLYEQGPLQRKVRAIAACHRSLEE